MKTNRLRSVESLEERIVLAADAFASIVYFFDVENPTGLGGYQPTTMADVREWMQLDESLTTSDFSREYWRELSLGNLDFEMVVNSDASGIDVPSLRFDDPNDFLGEVVETVVQQNAEQNWRASGEMERDGNRYIPSAVVVHNYSGGASALFHWDYEFSVGGEDYLVGDVFRIAFGGGSDYSMSNSPSRPYSWGMPTNWPTIAHEYAHNFFEEIDLYGGAGGKVAYWDLLGDASVPGKMSDVSSVYKEQLGWIDFAATISGPVHPKTTYRLKSFGETGEAIKIVPDPMINPEEYFVLEFRATPTEPQVWSPNANLTSEGLLIQHVNRRAYATGSQIGQIAPVVDIEESDGNDGKCWSPAAASRSTCDLPWTDSQRDFSVGPAFVGDAEFAPNNWPNADRDETGVLFPRGSKNAFTPFSEPSSDFYGGRKSGLFVTNIRRVGDEMVFDVEIAASESDPYFKNYVLAEEDRYFAGDFTGDGFEEILIFNDERLQLAEVKQNQLGLFWRSDHDVFQGWDFRPSDQIVVGDFNGDQRDDVVIHNGDYLRLFRSTGRSLESAWTAFDRIGAWNLSSVDEFHAADMDGDGTDDLFVRSPEWAGFLRSIGDRFEAESVVHQWVGGWRLNPDDQHFVGDFDGNGTDDVFVRSPEWAGILNYSNDSFRNPWIQNERIGNWRLDKDDLHHVGDYNGDELSDVFIRSDDYAALLLGTSTGFSNSWITGDPATLGNRIDGWRLGRDDRHHVGDFTGDGLDDIYIRSDGYAGILRGDNGQLRVEWLSDSVWPWVPDASDDEIVGNFNMDAFADVFSFRSTGAWREGTVLLTYRPAGGGAGSSRLELAWRDDVVSEKHRPDLSRERSDLVDQRYLGNFAGSDLDDVLTFDGDSLALYTNVAGDFQRVWSSGDTIGGWRVGPYDRIHVGDFNGDSLDDFFVRSDHWAGLMVANGAGFTNAWITGDPMANEDRIGRWKLGPTDKHYVGDFTGDGRDDVFVRSGEWAAILESKGNSFEEIWITGSPDLNQNRIGDWRLGPQDEHYVGDFNGDGREDLFVRSPFWAGLLLSEGNRFNNVWISGNPDENQNWIGGWRLGSRDRHSIGDFNGDGLSDVFIRSPQWAGLLTSNGTSLQNVWMTGEPTAGLNRVGDWMLTAMDTEVVGDFNDDGLDDILIRNPTNVGVLGSTGASLDSLFVAPMRLENWLLTAEDTTKVGSFCSVSRDEVFFEHPGGWSSVFTPRASDNALQGAHTSFSQLTSASSSGVQENACGIVDDYGDDRASAAIIALERAVPGTIEQDGDEDAFVVFAPAGESLVIETSLGSLEDSVLRIFDPSGVELAADDNSGIGFASKITWTSPESDSLYISVTGRTTEQLGTYELLVTARPSTPSGDFTDDGVLDVSDLDVLVERVVGGLFDASFDINDDNAISESDIDTWLRIAGATYPELTGGQPFLRGDANLDGRVDSLDLNAIGLNWQSETALGWSNGNFRASSRVDSADLNILALNWQRDLNAAAVRGRDPKPAFAAAANRRNPDRGQFQRPLDRNAVQNEWFDFLDH